ncbi:hypothetical protein AH04_132 [Erwinia phage AH04]|uniref:Virion structural protein n=1 Tax=Erwinia phage AH04 TaxID=2869569 RepID=A0AAE7X0K7_9CAUD|nr:hypothetical protein PQC02_gp182 [Erwinia phage AH04]QZA70610.1 hypothetical protein AH04_132 [Erwinia phage AH04]
MLNNTEFNAYILNTIAFARTITIKCEALAILDNQLLKQYYNIDAGTDKNKWKYYLNLYGEYHQVIDEMMTVQSLDNGEVINFTKANLDIHTATKRAYRLGSYYYTRLVAAYPAQLILINGILNPISPTESIPANDYQILRYNTDYVLWNEYQLIPALQEQIYANVNGSFKTEYVYIDNLMLPALLAQLYGMMISAILMIRKEADGTRYAHDFYIWSRLRSLGLSDVYKRVINNNQTMWLYHNLEYVLRILGRRKGFDLVLQKVLTDRNIPLIRYEVIQSTEDMTDTLEPKPYVLSRPINLTETYGVDTKVWTVSEVIAKELPLALDNEQASALTTSDAEAAIKYSLHSDVPTKVLESNLTDTTDRDPDRIMRVLHNEWIYLTSQGVYNINVDVVDARTGKTTRMSTPESVILWHYLIDRARGISRPGTIPEYNYWHVRKLVDPTLAELQSLGGYEILTKEVCENILKVHVDFPTLISPDTFFQKCQEVQTAMWKHKKLYSQVNNLFISSRRQNAVDACYANGMVKVGNYATYDDFLTKMDIDFIDYTPDECLDYAWSIWSKVTGWEDNSIVSVGEQQRLLINLMKDLTSYTVQYIGSTVTAEGQFNLPYMMLMDGDYWHKNGETGLEYTSAEFLPNAMTVKPQADLEAKELTFAIGGSVPIQSVAESVGHARLSNAMTLKPIDYDPGVNNVYLFNSMTLKEVVDNGEVENTLPH